MNINIHITTTTTTTTSITITITITMTVTITITTITLTFTIITIIVTIWQLPVGVRTNGVFAEVPQFPLMSFHGKCGQHVAAYDNNISTCDDV